MSATVRPAFRPAVTLLCFSLLAALPVRASEPSSPSQPPGWVGVFLGGDGPEPGPEAEPPRGVRVRAVVEGSPAESARLRASDRILAVDGAAVTSVAEVMAKIRDLSPDTSISLTVLRGKEEIDRTLRVGTRPASLEGLRPIEGWIGIEAIPLPKKLRAHFGAPDTAGILVSDVLEGSPAEAAGIRIGDVLYEIAGEPVESPGELARDLTEAGVENDVEIVVARDGARIVLEPRIARRPAVTAQNRAETP